MNLFSTFYCGTSEASWLGRTGGAWFILLHRLLRKVNPVKVHWRESSWALDSGGYNHVRANGGWVTPAADYVATVVGLCDTMREPDWAAPQDWMCEADALAATGLTASEHFARTVDNFVECTRLWAEMADHEQRIMPVIQMDPNLPTADAIVASALECWDRYEDAGVDLRAWPLVGVGSICRQQGTHVIGAVLEALQARGGGEMPLHGFGVKTQGLVRYAHLLASADSEAWSARARWGNVKWEGCQLSHGDCRNCWAWAAEWRRRLVLRVEEVHGPCEAWW